MTEYRLTFPPSITPNSGEVTWNFNETTNILKIANALENEVPYMSGEYPYSMTSDTLIFNYQGDSQIFRHTPYEGEIIAFTNPYPNIFDTGIIFHFILE